jgi:signal transduction histidine kinase/ligand-binding sensor domain-containing protein/DNA-binding response OmpR family regulator
MQRNYCILHFIPCFAMNLKRFFFSAFLMGLILTVSGQVKNSLFENFTANDGLIDERIHCIFQDSKGWIWIGTDYGITRFDGYEFAPFQINSPESHVLSSSLIRRIIEDNAGNIWIGTEMQGLFKIDQGKNILRQFRDQGLSHNSIWDIVEDGSGKLWIGTENGINLFDPLTEQVDQAISSEVNERLAGLWIRKLLIDHTDRLWIGSDKGITLLDPDLMSFEAFLEEDSEPRVNEVWDIFQDREEQIWVGTYLGGLKKYDDRSRSFSDIWLGTDNPRAITVRAIAQDKKGDLWFGTRGGLFSFDYVSQNIRFYGNEENNPYSLVHNSVLYLFSDKKGDLWVGTRNGLSFLNFNKRSFGYLSSSGKEPVLNNGEVWVIWEDDRENLWIGTESGGVNIYDSKQQRVQYLTTMEGLSQNCIKAIHPDQLGNVLIGTYMGGVNQYNPHTGVNRIFMHQPEDPESISDNDIWAIFRDSRERIWIGTSRGLDLFNAQKGTFSREGEKYQLGSANMIFEDPVGDLWVYSADIEKLTRISPDGSFEKFDIHTRAMCEVGQAEIWMATMGNGLVCYDLSTGVFKEYTTADGLSSNILHGIININDRYLWISGNNGISRFKLSDRTFTNYYNSDGLLNNKFNYGAFCRLKGNSIAFGGQQGVDFIFLDRVQENQYLPPVVLTGFRIFNREMDLHDLEEGQLILNHRQNMITFSFAALNYANSYKNRYKYFLEGFDEEWNDIGTSRMATYTNLDHGEYVFRVIGSNNDGVFNTRGLSFNLTILPPFWKTWWFRSLVILCLLGLFFSLFMMIRNREMLKQQLIFERETARKIKEVDRLKHQFFMNISHEIRTPLSLILGPVNRMIGSTALSAPQKEDLHVIKRNANNLNKLVNQLLDYRKLETGNMKLQLRRGNFTVFVRDLVESFRYSAEEQHLELTAKISNDSMVRWFDSEIIEKILNNLIFNAIKYSNPGGSVVVTVSSLFADEIEHGSSLLPPLDPDKMPSQEYAKIRVIDTGIGIEKRELPRIFDRFRRISKDDSIHASGSGIGLALTKEMVILHHGHIRVKSALNKGSKFTVYIPFNDPVEAGDIGKPEEARPEDLSAPPEDIYMEKSGKLALIVDDNQDFRKFVRSHFEPEYQVLEARNGKEAIDLALEHIPDIIIADVMMPVLDGKELCKRIKRDERTSHIPVIMLSALTSKENQVTGIDAGADDYLTKPFDPGLLKAKVDNLLSLRKSLRERYSREMVLKPSDIIVASPDEKFLKRLISLIEKNIAKEDLDVDFLSHNLAISRTQLYRKIGALTDMTPKEFVKDIRLKRAAQLLSSSSLHISEIAYSIGFGDVAYFRRCFKDRFGSSASEFRKSQKGKRISKS